MTEQLYRWVRASIKVCGDNKPKGEKFGDRISVLYKGYPEVLFYNGAEWRWFDQDGQHSQYPVQDESWSVIEWLEPIPSLNAGSLEQDFKEINVYLNDLYHNMTHNVKDAGHLWIAFTDKFNAFREKVLAGAAYVKGGEERLKGYNGSLLREYNKMLLSLLNNPTDEEIIGKLNELSPSVEKEIDEYEMIIASRPSLDIDKVVDGLKEILKLSKYDPNHDNMLYNMQEINKLAKELLNQSK